MALMVGAVLFFATLMMLAVVFFAWLMIRHLKSEIAWDRERIDYYEQRVDRALDLLASVRINAPVVTAMPAMPHRAPLAAERMQDDVRRLVMDDPELSGAGQFP